MKTDMFDQVFGGKKCIMAIMPHPDDTELYCGGTLARLRANGVEVVSVKMTNGGKGTKQSGKSEAVVAQTRSEEDRRAAAHLGVKPEHNYQLGIPDGEVEDGVATIERLAMLMRRYRPDLVITCNPEDVIIKFYEIACWVNHRDHRTTARVAIDAVYPYSRDTAFFPHQLAGMQSEYKPTTEFLLADYYDGPGVVGIDITDHLDSKRRAWRCHESAYTHEAVDSAIEFLNKDQGSERYYEVFRHVVVD